MHKAKIWMLTLALAAGLGCANRTVQAPVPGSANAADSDIYLSLVTTDSLIVSTRADLASNSFPAAWVANVKKSLNGLIQAYDIANVSYIAYHTTALAGNATATQLADVQNKMAAVQAATANLTAAKTGNQ